MLNFLFYLCLLLLSIGQFTSVSSSSDANIYLFDLAVSFFALYGLFYFLVSKKLLMPRYLILFFVFSAITAISLMWNLHNYGSEQMVVAAFYILRFVVYLLAGVVVYNMIKHDFITSKKVLLAFIYSGFLISTLGFIQLVALPDFETLDPLLGWDPHKNRLASTFFDPNFVGGYLALCLSIFLYFYSEKRKSLNWAIYLMAFVILAALFLTFSRSAWGMFAVIVLVYGIFKLRWLLLVALVLAFLAYFAVPRVQTRFAGVTDPADSAYFRLISWSNALEIVEDNAFLGVGFNAFRYAQEEHGFFDPGTVGGRSGAGSDSSFLFVLATTGIVGIFIFVLAYFFPIFDSVANNRTHKILIVASLFGLLLQSQFINAFFYPQILFLTAALLVQD